MPDIENLTIAINSSTKGAATNIDKLASSLEKLRGVLDGGGFKSTRRIVNALKPLERLGNIKISTTIPKRLTELKAAADTLKNADASGIERVVNSLKPLKRVKDIKISPTIPKRLTELKTAADLLRGADFSGLERLAAVLQKFRGLEGVKIPRVIGVQGGAMDGASSEAAEDAAGALNDSMVRVEESTESASFRLSDFLRNALKAAGGALNLKKAIESLKNAMTSATTRVGAFISSIARIIKYRAIRAVIKDMVQSFKDLYGWSIAYGTSFAKSMDKITTATTYLRNSLAAMAAPLIDAFAPVLDAIIDKAVEAINWVNQLFAAVSGADTYTVAKKVARTWESTFNNTSSSANKATKSAKELRRTLLGFDEINRLNAKQSTPSAGGSTGSGSSPYTEGYKDMFEQKPLTGGFKWISDFSKKIQDEAKGWPDWLKWLLGIAAVAAAWWGIKQLPKLLKKLLDWLLKMFGLKVPDWFRWLFGPKGDGGGPSISIPDNIEIPNGQIKVDVVPGDGLVGLPDHVDIPANMIPNMPDFKDLPVLDVPVSPSPNAPDLWKTFSDDWRKIPVETRTLYIAILAKTTAESVWRKLIDGWNKLPSRTLPADIKVGPDAGKVWDDWLGDWKFIPDRNLPADIDAGPDAQSIWDKLLGDWTNIPSKVLQTVIGTETTAQGLLDKMMGDWKNIPVADRTAYLVVAAKTTAEGIWNKLKNDWLKMPSHTLDMFLNPEPDADDMYKQFSKDWDESEGKDEKKGNFKVRLAKSGWNSVQEFIEAHSGMEGAEPENGIFGKINAVLKMGIKVGDEILDNMTFGVWSSMIKPGLQPVCDSLGQTIANALFGTEDENGEGGIVGQFKSFGDAVYQMFTGDFTGITDWVKTTFSLNWGTGWDGVFGWFTSAFDTWDDDEYDAFTDWGDRINNWVKGAFSSDWGVGWNGVVSGFGTIFEKIEGKVKDPINAVIGFLNSMIDKVETALNWVVGEINTVFHIDWNIAGIPIKFDPNVQPVEFNRIEPLAKGGILDSATMLTPNVLAGEAGREAVLPLENHTEWMDTLASRVWETGMQNMEPSARRDDERMIDLMGQLLTEMRKFNEKEFSAEITTSSIAESTNRMNRRAGTVVIPVN